MTFHDDIINELDSNKNVFEALFSNVPKQMINWKDDPKRWSLLEIICHLYDEEAEDFKARTKSVLDDPRKALIPFDPVAWVEERKYADQNYTEMQFLFLERRKESIEWLRSLEHPNWKNVFNHPNLGEMSAELFLANWLAHDHLHIRQIIKLKFDFLKDVSGMKLNYAGDW